MSNESGFSLVEMLAALFVLSLGAVATGDITSLILKSWDQAERDIQGLDHMAVLLSEIEQTQAKLVTEEVEFEPVPALISDTGEPLDLATARIDRTSECIFDLVGRKCR